MPFVQTKKEGWLVGLGQEGFAWVGGTVYNILKGVEQKRGEDTRILKRGFQAGSRGGSVSIKVTPFVMVFVLPL